MKTYISKIEDINLDKMGRELIQEACNSSGRYDDYKTGALLIIAGALVKIADSNKSEEEHLASLKNSSDELLDLVKTAEAPSDIIRKTAQQIILEALEDKKEKQK